MCERNQSAESAKNECNENGQYSRRPCLRIFGIVEQQGENCCDVSSQIFQKDMKLDIPNSEIDVAHHVGRIQKDKSRPFILHFASRKTKGTCNDEQVTVENTGIVTT